LEIAAQEGFEDICKLMVKFYQPQNEKNGPLHHAAKNGHLEICKILLENDKHSILNLINEDGLNALHFAAESGNLEICKLFLEKNNVDVNSASFAGNTPLHFASNNNFLEICKLLVEKKGANISKKDNDGWTALHFAAQNNNKEIFQFLLENGASLNEKNNLGKTPLDILNFYGYETRQNYSYPIKNFFFRNFFF